MAFLAPWFLAGAVAAAIPLVLHLLKREPEVRLRFAAVNLLMHAPVERAKQRNLHELLLLAIRMAALVLLALAFARPFFASDDAAAASGTTIVVLDRSYSLSSPGRFERAKQMARDAIANAPAFDAVGVVAFDDVAEILVRPSRDRAQAAAAIDRLTVGAGPTRYRAGLSAAAQLLGSGAGSIVVVSDLQASGWRTGDQTGVPASAKIEIADAGPIPDNLVVTALRQEGGRIVASIRHSGAGQRDARARLTLDDRPAGESVIALGPDAVAEAVFPLGAGAATASVSIDDPEGLQADNVRYAILGGNRPRVLVVTASGDLDREAYYARAALEAGAPGADSYEAVGVGAAELASWSGDRLARHAAVVVLSTRGLERRGREALGGYVLNGGGLLIAAGPDVDGDVIGDTLGTATPIQIATGASSAEARRALVPADFRHPVFQSFGVNAAALGLVEFREVAAVSGGACQALARFTTGETALIDCAAGDGRALVLASDLDNRWNDFPLHATFVPFLHEAVQYLAGGRAEDDDVLVGDASGADARRPGIAMRPADAGAAGGPPRQIAINVDPREADPARISAEEFQSAVTRLKDESVEPARVGDREQEERQQLWQYALALMLGLLVAEGIVAGRTA
jgi:hypothetical protein